MNIGSSASDFGLVIFLLVPGLLIPLLSIALGLLIARILRLPLAFAGLFAIGLVGLVLLGASLYLGQAGQVVDGKVEKHKEQIILRSQGDWQQRFELELSYRLNESATEQSAVSLRPSAAQFDQLSLGQSTKLRVLPLFRSLALVRLADSTTAQFIPWFWLALAAGVALYVGLAQLMFSSTASGLILIAITFLAALSIPCALAYQRWQDGDNLASKPLRASAQVSKITPVSQVDPFPCRPGSGSNCARRRSRFDVAQPYEIIEMRFLPVGAAGEVIAVDSINAGSSLTVGSMVEIAYDVDKARSPSIIAGNHSHHWLNTLGITIPIALFVLLFMAVVGWAGTRVRRTRKRASSPTI